MFYFHNHPRLAMYINKIFREDTIYYAAIYVLFILGALLLLQSFPISFHTLRGIVATIAIITALFILMLVLITAELVLRLI